MPDPIKVMLVDPNELFRCGMARLLEAQADFQVVTSTARIDDAAALIEAHAPDVVLCEVEFAGRDVMAIVQELRQRWPHLQIVFLAMSHNAEIVLQSALAGAAGYLQKNILPDELFARLRGLRAGEAAFSLGTVRTLLQQLNKANLPVRPLSSSHHNLTPREYDVLLCVAQGMTNKQIGEQLLISEHTVRNHLCNIYQKLNVKNRLQVAIYGVVHGLVDISAVL